MCPSLRVDLRLIVAHGKWRLPITMRFQEASLWSLWAKLRPEWRPAARSVVQEGDKALLADARPRAEDKGIR